MRLYIKYTHIVKRVTLLSTYRTRERSRARTFIALKKKKKQYYSFFCFFYIRDMYHSIKKRQVIFNSLVFNGSALWNVHLFPSYLSLYQLPYQTQIEKNVWEQLQSEEQLVFKLLNFMFRALTAAEKEMEKKKYTTIDFAKGNKGVVINALLVIAWLWC